MLSHSTPLTRGMCRAKPVQSSCELSIAALAIDSPLPHRSFVTKKFIQCRPCVGRDPESGAEVPTASGIQRIHKVSSLELLFL